LVIGEQGLVEKAEPADWNRTKVYPSPSSQVRGNFSRLDKEQ
jgi:hypothetical protein